jgi:hypothetical protein
MSDYTGYAFKCRHCGAEFATKEQADSHYEDEHKRAPARYGEQG